MHDSEQLFALRIATCEFAKKCLDVVSRKIYGLQEALLASEKEKKRDGEGVMEGGVGRLEEELGVARREEEGWERKVQEAVGRLVLVEGELRRKEGGREMLEGRRLERMGELKEVEGSISRIPEGGDQEADLEEHLPAQVAHLASSVREAEAREETACRGVAMLQGEVGKNFLK